MKSLCVNISSFCALWILHPNFACWASLQVWQMLIRKRRSWLMLWCHAGRVPAQGCQCCSVPPRGSCACMRTGFSWGWNRQHNMPVKTLPYFLRPHCFPFACGWIRVVGNGWVIPGRGMKWSSEKVKQYLWRWSERRIWVLAFLHEYCS